MQGTYVNIFIIIYRFNKIADTRIKKAFDRIYNLIKNNNADENYVEKNNYLTQISSD